MIPVVLTIAGSDSGGGAGIQADLKSFQAWGVFGTSVITALTAQNTQGVSAIKALPASFVGEQLKQLLADFSIQAYKTGMLFSSDIIQKVRKYREEKMRDISLVVDPVMTTSNGERLLASKAEEEFRSFVFCADLLTPNIPEAEILLQHPIRTFEDMEEAAQELAYKAKGRTAILLKGGHLQSPEEVRDVYYHPHAKQVELFSYPRIHTRHSHGTGCTLSAAITAAIAQSSSQKNAGIPNYSQLIAKARSYLQGALEHAPGLGKGKGPLHHFWQTQSLSKS